MLLFVKTRLSGAAREEHRLHAAEMLSPRGCRWPKTADETAALDILHVLGGEVLHALAEIMPLAAAHPEGDRACERIFRSASGRRRPPSGRTRHSRDCASGARCRRGKTAALHGVEHVVRCAVQNAGNSLGAVGLRRARDCGETDTPPPHAALRNAAPFSRARAPQAQTVRCNHRLFAVMKCFPASSARIHHGDMPGQPAERFHYGVDRRIAENERGVAHHEALDRPTGAHEHRPCPMPGASDNIE